MNRSRYCGSKASRTSFGSGAKRYSSRGPLLLAFLLGNGQHLDDARVLGQGRLEVCVNDIDFVDFAIEELLRRQVAICWAWLNWGLSEKPDHFFFRYQVEVLEVLNGLAACDQEHRCIAGLVLEDRHHGLVDIGIERHRPALCPNR